MHLEHAKWLALHDQFVEANQGVFINLNIFIYLNANIYFPISAFIKAGHYEEAASLLESLIDCAISEKRYKDASYCLWLKAVQFLEFSMQKLVF